MCAINLLMVMMSRTRGMLCSVTLSCVSSAAAIAGNAEFFAPLMTTVPWRGFPPRIRNLSMRVPCPSRNSFAERLPQIAAGADQAAPRLLRADRALQHHERHAHIVSRRTQSVFCRRQFLPAGLRQYSQRPVPELFICQHRVNHQVLIHMSQPRHRRRRQHVEHHLLRRPRLQPRRSLPCPRSIPPPRKSAAPPFESRSQSHPPPVRSPESRVPPPPSPCDLLGSSTAQSPSPSCGRDSSTPHSSVL